MEPKGSPPDDKYRIVEALSRGAQATVYRARQVGLDRTVIMKYCEPTPGATAELQARALERMTQEARILASISSPYVLQLLDFSVGPGWIYLIYPDEEGYALSEVMKRATLPNLPMALHVLRDGLGGLAAIHAREIVHRDVKPQNVLYIEDAGYKLIDLGLARDLTTEGIGTSTGVFLGTPSHAAPGQLRSQEPVPRDDVYSLGLIGYHLATGSFPFPKEDLSGLLHHQLNTVPPRADSLVSAVPPRLADLLAGMLEKRESRRPSAQEAFDLVQAMLEGGVSVATARPPVDGLARTSTVPFAAASLESEPAAKGGFRQAATARSPSLAPPPDRRWWAAGVGVGVLGLAVAALLTSRPGPSGAPPRPSPGPTSSPPRPAVGCDHRPLLEQARREFDAFAEGLASPAGQLRVRREGPWYSDPLVYRETLEEMPTILRLRDTLGPRQVAEELWRDHEEELEGLDRDLAALGVEPPLGVTRPVSAEVRPGPIPTRVRGRLLEVYPPLAAVLVDDLPLPVRRFLQRIEETMAAAEELLGSARAGDAGAPEGLRTSLVYVSDTPLRRLSESPFRSRTGRVRHSEWAAVAARLLRRALVAAGRAARAAPQLEPLVALVVRVLGDELVAPLLLTACGSLEIREHLGLGPGEGPGAVVAATLRFQRWRYLAAQRIEAPSSRYRAMVADELAGDLAGLVRKLRGDGLLVALTRIAMLNDLTSRGVGADRRLEPLRGTLLEYWPSTEGPLARPARVHLEHLAGRMVQLETTLDLSLARLQELERVLVIRAAESEVGGGGRLATLAWLRREIARLDPGR